jgi:hypothetical protein
MSSDETGAGTITTYVYDSNLGSLVHRGGSRFDLHGRLVYSADRAPLPSSAAAEPRKPY